MHTSLGFRLVGEGMRVVQPLLAWQLPASISPHLAVPKAGCESKIFDKTWMCSDGLIHRNIAQVSGGERELRTYFLKPFNRACVQSLSIMTAYSSYDGIPAIANSREC